MARKGRLILSEPTKEKRCTVSTALITRKWYSTAEVADMLGFGLSKTKFLVLSGEIRSLKVGRHRKVLPEWVEDYIRRCTGGEAA